MSLFERRLQGLAALSFLVLLAISCGKDSAPVQPKQDTTAPVITAGPTVRHITRTSAIVTWFTDDASKSIVEFSTDTSYKSAAGDSALVTSHSVTLTGLAPGTTYHFRVFSCNAVDLATRSVASTFVTLADGRSKGKIVFSSTRNGTFDIYTMNMDGTNQERLTINVGHEIYPAWSWDGSRIAFAGYSPYIDVVDEDIIVINADGNGWRDLLPLTCSDSHPAWSPDGSKIAFSRLNHDPAKSWDIFVMDSYGENASPLTMALGSDDEPSWSPDGTKIAFVGTRDGYSEVFVMHANGGGGTPLTQDSVMVSSPRWSPDGTKIAYVRGFVSGEGHEPDIAIINADGTNPVRVTHGVNSSTVAWDPDGAHLVYDNPHDWDIHRIAVDGSGDVNLTNSPGRDMYPDCR